MSKNTKNTKKCLWALIIIGAIGAFITIRYGTFIIKPKGNVINESFIKQCRSCYLVIRFLIAAFVAMIIVPLANIIDFGRGKDSKISRIIINLCICICFVIPMYSVVKISNQEIKCQEYVISHKEYKEYRSVNRRGRHVARILWLKDGDKLRTSAAVYNSVEVGDDVYVVCLGKTIINAFPVSEYEYELTNEMN